MIRKVIFAAAMMLSLNAFADATALVGKWTTTCAQADNSGQLFYKSLVEFNADGSASSSADYFSDSACTTALGNSGATASTYTATDADIKWTGNDNGQVWLFAASYVATSDTLDLTITEVSVDGKPEPAAVGQTVSLTKVK